MFLMLTSGCRSAHACKKVVKECKWYSSGNTCVCVFVSVCVCHHTKRIQIFTNSCIRIITGTSLWKNKRNTQLRRNAKIQRVDVMMQHRRLQWLGHVERRNEERIPRKILVSRIVGRKRSKGGQKKR